MPVNRIAEEFCDNLRRAPQCDFIICCLRLRYGAHTDSLPDASRNQLYGPLKIWVRAASKVMLKVLPPIQNVFVRVPASADAYRLAEL